uniref:Uncharacterized protein n=1 Tax=Knipowitschia caucasica TaxID=637954 RepID=A0AAV2KDQ9_KNICA
MYDVTTPHLPLLLQRPASPPRPRQRLSSGCYELLTACLGLGALPLCTHPTVAPSGTGGEDGGDGSGRGGERLVVTRLLGTGWDLSTM